MYKLLRQALATILLGSLLTGCSISEKITAKFTKPAPNPQISAITALDEKSSEVLKQSKDLKNPVRVHLSYAKWKEETGDFVEAERSYRLVLNTEPDNESAMLGLARILMLQGREADAGLLFQSALKQSPDDPDVLLQVSQFYADKSQWSQATQLLKRANELDPQNKNIHFHLGVVLANSGDIRGSYNQFRSVLSERDSHFNLAKILFDRGDMVSAERHFARVLEIDPEFEPAQDLMAQVKPQEHSPSTQYASHQRNLSRRRTIPTSAQRIESTNPRSY